MIEKDRQSDIEFDTTLRGVAMGPAIVGVFQSQIDKATSTQELARISHACDSKIAAFGKPISTASSSIGFTKILIIGILSTAVVATGVIASSWIRAEAPPVGDAPAIAEFVPEAEIVWKSESKPDQNNPYEANLVTKEGAAAGWEIVDEAGTAIASGIGDTFSSELQTLTPGVYKIQWKVIGEVGGSATVSREIRID
jgi:hypothetical protein